MQKIIIALDLQEHTALVVQKAEMMAEKFNSELHMVHVISPVSNYMATPIADPLGAMEPAILSENEMTVVEAQKKSANESMLQLAESMTQKPKEIKIFLGDIEDEVLGYAKEIGAGLIVMGTHQHSGLSRLLSRETSVKMLHESQIPILVVPTDIKKEEK